MSATEHLHSPTPEEVMAYLDGEADPASRAAVEAHLPSCAACQAVASEFRGVSNDMVAWIVEQTPGSLRAPLMQERRTFRSFIASSRPIQVAAIASLAAVAVLIVSARSRVTRSDEFAPKNANSNLTFLDQKGPGGGGRTAGGLPAAPPAARQGSPATENDFSAAALLAQGGVAPPFGTAAARHRPMVIRTATLRLVVKDVGTARLETERVVAQAAGFVDQMTVTGEAGTAQTLHGILRVPADRLVDVTAALRRLGQILEDSQQTEDVTDQIVDLDTRLANARTTEQRLVDILKQRTGKLSDVLAVERELARVRLEIEQMDAERTNVNRRVTYSAITVDMTEERKASLTAPLSFASRFRIAVADGLDGAVETLVGALLLALSVGPTLIVWSVPAVLLAIALRHYTRRPRPGQV